MHLHSVISAKYQKVMHSTSHHLSATDLRTLPTQPGAFTCRTSSGSSQDPVDSSAQGWIRREVYLGVAQGVHHILEGACPAAAACLAAGR